MRRSVGMLGLVLSTVAGCGSNAAQQVPGTGGAAGGSSGGANEAGQATGGSGDRTSSGGGGNNNAGGGATGVAGDAACKVAALYAGGCTCVVKQDSTLWCFGSDSCQGVSTTDEQTSLREVKVPGGVQTLAVGQTGEVIAINQTGDVYYWGHDQPPSVEKARVGGEKAGPIALPGAPKNARLVAIASPTNMCVVSGDNDVSCLRDDKWKAFQLGSGSPIVKLAPSDYGACALDAAGQVHCWEAESTDCQPFTADVAEKVTSLEGNCLVTESHAVYCGLADRTTNLCGAQPTLVPNVKATRYVERTNANTCYLDQQGSVHCKGDGTGNGDGANVRRTEFTTVDLWAGPAKDYALGTNSCVLLDNDRLWCWGSRLPKPGPKVALSPIMVPLCATDKAPTPPEPTLLDSFEDVTGTPAAAVSSNDFAGDCAKLPVGTVVYSAGLVDLDYAVCGPTGVLEQHGFITGFYGGQHYVGLFTYVDESYPVPAGQQKSYGAVFYNEQSEKQATCMSNDGAIAGGLTQMRIAVGDHVCGASTLSSASPPKYRLSFSKRKYAEIELKPVPGTAEIPRPM